MGVPVVTLAGDSHASRVGLSLLNAAGLGELAARTRDEYIAIATRLAHDRATLATMRGALRERMEASPLCDARAFIRRFEESLRSMWRLACG